jgi:predicted trehalose synthase
MMGLDSGLSAGQIGVATTSNQGHSVQFWVARLLQRLISVSDTAPAPIRDQARAFRNEIEPLLEHYMVQAIKSDRTTLHNQLKKAGQHEAAELVLKL